MMGEERVLAAAAERPALRGKLHLGAAVLAVFGMAWLLLKASSPAGYVGGAIFAASLTLLYTTSSVYHQVTWSPRWRRHMRRIDHAVIFVLIGGTYTPFCLDVGLAWGIPMLSVVWGLAGAGAVMKVAWPDAPRWLGVTLYISLGWAALVAMPELISHFAVTPLALLASGGVLYTIGGLVYAVRRPDPWPRVFGYHEVFHAFVVAASAVHYSTILIYIL